MHPHSFGTPCRILTSSTDGSNPDCEPGHVPPPAGGVPRPGQGPGHSHCGGLTLSRLRVLRLSFPLVDTASLLSLPFLQDDLARLEPGLRDAVSSGDRFLDEVTTHLIAAGGKRLRPPAWPWRPPREVAGPPHPDDLQGAVAGELVHLASLYHDDVMDEALVRRNVESVNARFGNLVAIVAGDFLLARSAEIAASLGTEIAGLLANTLGLFVPGTGHQGACRLQHRTHQDDYLHTIEGRPPRSWPRRVGIGALTGGLPRTEVDTLTDFGRCSACSSSFATTSST